MRLTATDPLCEHPSFPQTRTRLRALYSGDYTVLVNNRNYGAGAAEDGPYPEMGAEDFSYVMEQVPGAYFFLGTCASEDPATAPDNHSPRAAFDDSVLHHASAWLAEVALRRCARD